MIRQNKNFAVEEECTGEDDDGKYCVFDDSIVRGNTYNLMTIGAGGTNTFDLDQIGCTFNPPEDEREIGDGQPIYIYPVQDE